MLHELAARADGQRGLFFDYGNDDYWDPPPPRAALVDGQPNRFLCPNADCNVTPGAMPDPPPAPAPAAASAHCRQSADSETKRIAVVGAICGSAQPKSRR